MRVRIVYSNALQAEKVGVSARWTLPQQRKQCTYLVIGPSNQITPPFYCPDGALASMQDHFFMAEPALFALHERSGHTSAYERARRAFTEIRFESDTPHRSFEIKDVLLRGR